MAHRLLDRFGTFGDVLAAHPRERRAILADHPEIEEALRALRLAMGQILEAKLPKRTVLSTDRAVLDYLRARMAFEPIEIFRILFLNAANGLLADEEIARGTVGAVCVHPREILRRCLELGATAILLVHNHPSGDPQPSIADRTLTARIAKAAACFDVTVHDHLVIARHGIVSFRQAGYL
ncbi:JAB domain-containing protein [Novosphingobium rosa]|uniref:JAB domain-containing protein n=1 Tax=Novosphingobium rosa TaxID=76978 RepID=UPI0024809B52|nr:DNA repair protein RadC [Novosphingobium rosa]